MKNVQIGFSTGCFYKRPIFDCLEAIRRSGFSILEISSSRPHMDYADPEQVRAISRRLQELELTPVSFHAPYGPHIDITHPDADRRRSAEDEILKACRAAAEIGAVYFVLHPGPEIANMGDVPERHHRIENGLTVLNAVSECCRQNHIKLLVENMLPHLFLGYMNSMFGIYNRIEPPPMGFCFDTGHAFLTGHMHKVLDLVGERTLLVHANDNGGTTDDHLPPGEGRIPWYDFFTHLKRRGFAGTMILELACFEDRSVEQVLADAARSRDRIRALIETI
jgi:sugar phosphate isomerase/epimerase